MILVKNRKFRLCLFLDRICLEIMCDDHLAKKGLPRLQKYVFSTKIGNFLFVFFKQNKPRNNAS